jgi:hypothetical protein
MKGYIASIEKKTLDNTYFRKVLFTGKYLQLVVKRSVTKYMRKWISSFASSKVQQPLF